MDPSQKIGQRIKAVRGELSQKAFGLRIALSQTAVTALENGQSEPRLGTFNSIVQAFGVNPEWLRTGSGEMFGRALTPRPAAEPTPDFTSAAGTIDATVNLLLKEQLTEARERAAADRALITWLQGELGKLPGSSDAAGRLHIPAPAPLPPVGFRLRVQHRAGQQGTQAGR